MTLGAAMLAWLCKVAASVLVAVFMGAMVLIIGAGIQQSSRDRYGDDR